MSFARAASVEQDFLPGMPRWGGEPWMIAGELKNKPLKFLTCQEGLE